MNFFVLLFIYHKSPSALFLSLLVGWFVLFPLALRLSFCQLGFWQIALVFLKDNKNVLPFISVCNVCKVYLFTVATLMVPGVNCV